MLFRWNCGILCYDGFLLKLDCLRCFLFLRFRFWNRIILRLSLLFIFLRLYAFWGLCNRYLSIRAYLNLLSLLIFFHGCSFFLFRLFYSLKINETVNNVIFLHLVNLSKSSWLNCLTRLVKTAVKARFLWNAFKRAVNITGLQGWIVLSFLNA